MSASTDALRTAAVAMLDALIASAGKGRKAQHQAGQPVFGALRYQTGETPITADLVETVLSRQIGDLEPALTRHGDRLKDVVEQFDAKAA